MKRLFDLMLAVPAGLSLLVPILLIAAERVTPHSSILYWSDRVGCENCIFRMPKFRSMRIDAPSVATHLLGSPS